MNGWPVGLVIVLAASGGAALGGLVVLVWADRMLRSIEREWRK